MGLQRETVSRGVTGMYAQVLFAVVLERLLFGVIPSLLSVLGAVIILSSAFYVVVSNQVTVLVCCCQTVDFTQMKKAEISPRQYR